MKLLVTAAFAAGLLVAGSASATAIVVKAYENSTGGGTGASTGVILTSGQNFSVSVNAGDLWNAGALPRWSNADGLTGNLFATGTDDSGAVAGTLIGQNFGLYGPFAYGALVGSINGVYQLIGTNFNGPAWGNGELLLHYWDSNFGDNTEFITANVMGVPEPATWALMISGFGLVGATLRRRRLAAI